MKNWLDNYNDSEIKLPPAFVGQGTFNGPMFNNGAVNGQFQKGGYVSPTMPDLRPVSESTSNKTYIPPTNSAFKLTKEELERRDNELFLKTLRKEQTAYKPSKQVDKLKERLSEAHLASIPFSETPIGATTYLGTALAGATGDLYTGTRYLFDGQIKNALTDYGEALINFLPYRTGRFQSVYDKSKTLNKFDKSVNRMIDVLDVGANADDILTPYNYKNGGSLPGSVGFTYARTSGIPSKGPHRNQTYKTDASAQNGQEMSFYQHGLDWNPKMISKNGSVIKDDNGYWNPDNWGKPVEINSNNITMQGVYQPLLGISDTGHTQLMHPGEEYKFKGKKVTEYPMAQNGKNVRQPIITNNPNDPRLRAYNDSLSKYNITQDLLNNKIITKQNFDKAIKIQGNLAFPVTSYYNPNNKNEWWGNYSTQIKKPVQPVVYQKPKPSFKDFVKTANPDYMSDDYDLEAAYKNLPEKTMKAWAKDPEKNHLPDTYKKPNHPTFSKESVYYKPGMEAGTWRNDVYIPNRGQIVGRENNLQVTPETGLIDRSLQRINTEQQPTNYSFHYPIEGTFDRGNPQGVKYFNDRAEWQKFLDENDYNSAEEKNGSGQASGTLKKGRNGLRQEQKGLQNLDNLLNFTNYNTPQPGGWMDRYTH